MTLSLKLPLLGMALLLAACRSDPIHYHTLIPPQDAGTIPGTSSQIQFEALTVPPQVDRPQMVVRQGNSGLAILETEWWGASLMDEMQNALVDQLANASLSRRYSLRVDVQRFDSIPGQYGLIDATWRLRPLEPGNPALFKTCRSVLQTPSGASLDELVTAQQNNVKRLAAAIVQGANSAGNACPANR